MATVRLTDLLPTSGYLLPYALSLFFASLVLTFAGAFLTLDRTRSFAPVGDAFQDRQKSTSRLIASFVRGGMGGILTGFVFGSKQPPFFSSQAETSLLQFTSPLSCLSLYQALLYLNLSNQLPTCPFGYSRRWSHRSLREDGNILVFLPLGSAEGAFGNLTNDLPI